MGNNSDFLDPLLSPTFQDDGTDKTRRANINLVGFTVTDDPTNDATVVTATGGGAGSVAFADLAEMRAETSLADGETAVVASPVGSWVYSASTGAGMADDGLTIVKPDSISGGAAGRWYNVNSSPVLPTIAALRLAVSGQQPSVQVQTYSRAGDQGGDSFDFDSADTTSTDNAIDLIVAGTRRYHRRYNGLVSFAKAGLKLDAVELSNIQMTAGSNVVTGVTFPASSFGKTIHVQYAGVAGADLHTTILDATHTTANAGTSVVSGVTTTASSATTGGTNLTVGAVVLRGAGLNGTDLITTASGIHTIATPALTSTTTVGTLAYYGTDDTTAAQNLATYLLARGGGSMDLPPGRSMLVSSLQFDDTQGFKIRGNRGLSYSAGASIIFTNGTGTLCSAKSTVGFSVNGVRFVVGNSAHSGDVLNDGHSGGSGADTGNLTVAACAFIGNPNGTSAAAITLENDIIVDLGLEALNTFVRFREGVVRSGYSNVVSLRGVFIACGGVYSGIDKWMIRDPGQTWDILAVFQPGIGQPMRGMGYTMTAGSTTTVTFTAATNLVNHAGHVYPEGALVVFASSGTLAAPLVAGRRYYVRNPTGADYQVADTYGGTVIDITTAGSGTQTDARYTPASASVDLRARFWAGDAIPNDGIGADVFALGAQITGHFEDNGTGTAIRVWGGSDAVEIGGGGTTISGAIGIQVQPGLNNATVASLTVRPISLGGCVTPYSPLFGGGVDRFSEENNICIPGQGRFLTGGMYVQGQFIAGTGFNAQGWGQLSNNAAVYTGYLGAQPNIVADVREAVAIAWMGAASGDQDGSLNAFLKGGSVQGEYGFYRPSVNGTAATFTADAGTDTISSAGIFRNGDKGRVTNSGGALPAGLPALTDLFVVNAVVGVSFQLALTFGGSPINITTNGTGTQTFTRIGTWIKSFRVGPGGVYLPEVTTQGVAHVGASGLISTSLVTRAEEAAGTLLGQIKRWTGSAWVLVGVKSGALADVDATKSISDGNQLILPPATLSANRTLTLTPSAVNAESFEVQRLDVTANTYAIVNGGPGAGTLYTFPVSEARGAVFKSDGTDLTLVSTYALNAQVA